jgi:hypothetical protein
MTRLRFAMLMAVLCALPAPALAQVAAKAAPEYYVIVDTRTKKCAVIDKPLQVDSPAVTVATDAIYPSHAAAESAIRSLKPCQAS